MSPPSHVPRRRSPGRKPLGPLALLRVLVDNPLEAWTEAHFNEPIVMGGLPFMRVAVVSDPAAIRHVLLDNYENYQKDWLQRRILSAGLSDGLLTAESKQWRKQRRMLAPLFARRTVGHFSSAMVEAARALVTRLDRQRGEVLDLAVEVTRVSLDVLERTIFSDGLGNDPEEIRKGMKLYFEAIGQIDPLDVLGLPISMPRLGRMRARASLRMFEQAIDAIIVRRRRQLAEAPDGTPQDLLTLLLQAEDPQTGARLSESEVRSNVLTFISAGHETTANSLTWSLFLLSQAPDWCDRLRAEAERELDGPAEGLSERLVETRAVIEEFEPALSADHRDQPRRRQGGHPVRAPDPARHHDRHRALCGAPSPHLVVGAGPVRSHALSRWRARDHPTFRLYSVRRRPAHLHRRQLRHAGSRHRTRHTGAAFSHGIAGRAPDLATAARQSAAQEWAADAGDGVTVNSGGRRALTLARTLPARGTRRLKRQGAHDVRPGMAELLFRPRA